MAASVRIEDEAFADRRYDRLAQEAGLADADHARGKMAVLWRQCTIEQTHNLEVFDVVQVLGPDAVSALEKARLGELDPTVLDHSGEPTVRIRGSAGRIEWLKKLRDNGKKGGRPRKNQKVFSGKTKRKPSGSENQNPPAPAPAPAPVNNPPSPPRGKVAEATSYFLEGYNRYFNQSRRPEAWLDEVRKALKAGYTPDEMRGAAWGAKQRCAGSDEVLANFKPSTVLRLKSREGKTTLPQWLEAAEAAWRETAAAGEQPPWRKQLRAVP